MGRAGRSSGGRSSGRSGGFSSGGRSGGFSGGGRSGRGSASRQTRNSYPHHSPGYQPGYRRYRSGGSYGNAAITSPFSATTAVILIVVVVIALAFSAVAGNLGTGSNIPASTAHREALPAGMAQQTDYYTDELGWITNRSELTAGLKHFYQKTGIQPYLYIVDNINGNYSPTIEQLSSFARATYNQLFTDEAHFLLVFQEANGAYNCGYHIGDAAESVLDDEAISILSGYIGRYYTQDIDDEQFFSYVFRDTADRIMAVTRSPVPFVIGGIVLLLLVALLFSWWKRAKAQRNREAEQLEEILRTPLESFDDADVEERAKRYQDKD